ncbi:interferon-induced very large GTPase 1 [Danio rerio]|uniref:Interferon-induced very large GTPase 1 n=2 Tax=Danio rerio TaxID=7955 RepID=A0AC58J0A2_DANRE|nr:interferon-induced very large GTPase 1-like [Danio rerio]|eukprot:XP_001346132.4 interferon-induced very large GTPase 1-like [Danio rerio]
MRRMDTTTSKTTERQEVNSGASGSSDIRSDQYLQQQNNEKIMNLFHRLHLEGRIRNTFKNADVLQLNEYSLQSHESCVEKELIQTFIQKLLMMNYRARNINVKMRNEQKEIQQKDSDSFDEGGNFFDDAYNTSLSERRTSQSERIHPMDVQMAVFHCADGFLKQLMVTKLSQCQFALPLLVPDPETQQIEFPLWTFRQINKSWKIRNTNNETISQTQPIYKAQTPMVFFFRFGSVSSSKSQLMNSLINDKHNTFFHRNCPGSSRSRVLMDGVVEIAWFCPSGSDDDKFTDCVAFCNLHGDAGDHEKQWRILTELASVNVVLLQKLDRNVRHAEKIQNLYSEEKPLISLFSDDKSAVNKMRKHKYKIGLKDRNQSDVSEDLMKALNDCLSESSPTFRLEDVSKHSDIRVDEEDDEDCRRGRAAAQQMISLLKEKKLTEIKESFLPHQGKLWHQWSQKNKELHRPQGDEIEIVTSRKKAEMKKIREEQHKLQICEFMKLFLNKIISNAEQEKLFFLKYLTILLDEHTSADLCTLHHKYDKTWSNILKLKEKNDKSEQFKAQGVKQLKAEETELERISEDIHAATFGLEHIMREIGQIYESCSSVKESKKHLPFHFSSLPNVAAKMMISGFPLELMDGDAAHVPVVWISAVLDQLIQKLGDQTRVFVLSVLGLQSSGKSTMLNAMFGLQFAVSAGRTTRGAFMQLVKVSEEMKTQMNCDYILVVDTEGLRALELAGRSTRHHDNELATFVVGLANLTLINIFGENLSEMQDVLQIVVQAFMRMKKVKLDPICMFVHQNVSDVTAGEKNMEGRRRLQETLDEMTKLAAEEEVYDAERFSDVIRFDVQNDVKYFAQLWEGSPPLAPPNPNYCENIQKLKNTILSKTSGCLTLSRFKGRVDDLWKALLNENFVFSFKNILEIAVYRRLETKYSDWTWKLRSAMLKIEEKFHNRVANGYDVVEESDLLAEMNETKEVKASLVAFFEEDRDKDILSQWRARFETKITDLHDELIKKTKRRLEEVIQQKKIRENLDAKKTEYENKLFCRSKELALQFKNNERNEQQMSNEFDSVWSGWIDELANTPLVENIDLWKDVTIILSENHQLADLEERKQGKFYKQINHLNNYSDYIMLKRNADLSDQDQSSEQADARYEHKEEEDMPVKQKSNSKNVEARQNESQDNDLLPEDHDTISFMIADVMKQTNKILERAQKANLGFHHSYIQDMTACVQEHINQFHNQNKKCKLKKEFSLDLCLFVCERAHDTFNALHNEFKNANDPRIYLERQKPQYYSVFKNFCKGATTTTIFAKIMCSELESSILNAVYNKTAIELADLMRSDLPAFNGNKSKLEKHILKTLAEREIFEEYMKYISDPRDYFKHFIMCEVNKFIDQQQQKVLTALRNNLMLKVEAVTTALCKSIEEVKGNRGDADMWLKRFTETLRDELKFSGNSYVDLSEITDLDFLKNVLMEGLTPKISELEKGFSINDIKMEKCRKKPDELLIDHFCQCCWVQCPFCGVTCTNTIANHPGDHSAPLHRNTGVTGMSYRDTTNLSLDICTSVVASDRSFYTDSPDNKVLWKEYRKAGGVFDKWSITPDLSELPYWKWFVCRFQKDLEKYHSKTFKGCGKIPGEWRKHTKARAIQSLEEYT